MLNSRVISQRPEHIADIIINNFNTDLQLPTLGGQIPNDRFIHSLELDFEGRATAAAGTPPSAVLADAPFSIIENIRISGYHRPRTSREEFINVRASDLRVWSSLYSSTPLMVTPTTLQTGAQTNDIKFNIPIPFTPMALPIAQVVPYLLDAPNYDNLTLTVRMGDEFSIFSGQAAGNVTWSAFGSATGRPRIRVSGYFSMAPNQFAGALPARTWREYYETVSGDILSGTTNGREYNIPRGFAIRSVLIKTGVKATTTSAGNNSYLTLNNNIASNVKIMRGTNRMIRWYTDFNKIQQELAKSYGINFSQTGYAVIDFAQKGSITERLDTTGLIAGPSGDTDLFVQEDLTGAANQAQLFMIEQIKGLSATARPIMMMPPNIYHPPVPMRTR